MKNMLKGLLCKWNRLLFKLAPVNAWKSAIIRKHLDSCPDCLALHEPLPGLTHIGVTADDVPAIPELWEHIHRRIAAEQSPVFHPRYLWYRLYPRPTRRLVIAAAAMALVLLLIPLTMWWRTSEPAPVNHQAGIALENRDIVIHSLEVENRPAQAVVFQSNREDRVIVWVKK